MKDIRQKIETLFTSETITSTSDKMAKVTSLLVKKSEEIRDDFYEKLNMVENKQGNSRSEMLVADDEFVVAVVAPMSSGKSTILNAMLGQDLLPSKNIACTAIPMRITDIDGISDIKAQAVYQDDSVSEWHSLSDGPSSLNNWNKAEYKAIEIHGDFPNIDNHTRRMVFLDTPGPNNSTNMTHGEITHKLLSENGFTFLIFVLNATQFGVNDEQRLLKNIANKMKEDGNHSNIVFLVNKIDELKPDRGECPESHVDKVKHYLEETGFQSPTIIPVMGKLALELRTCLTAHHVNAALPFSKRAQRRIAREIECVLELRESYSKAFKYTSYGKPFSASLSRQPDKCLSICLGEQTFLLQDICEIESITGIPTLEMFLQASLIAHPVSPPSNDS